MKSSLEKFGRKLTMHKKDHHSNTNPNQASNQLDELLQASKDMQDLRNCYDGLIAAAAAMTNSIFEFSESLHEMGTCLTDKTTVDADGESGRVLSTLGNIQSELRKIADVYRSYMIVTITNPSESLLSELRKVEEMKLQCDEKREAYEYMMSQHKEKGKLRSGKGETSAGQKLQEAQDEYNEAARICVFRVKSLKEGQFRSLLTQATRHHAAQMDFFRKGFKALEAIDPVIRLVAEKHRIDYQLSALDSGNVGESEATNSYERLDDGELSFDYRSKKQGVDDVPTSSYLMEVDRPDVPHLQVPTLEDREIINHYKHQGEQFFSRQKSQSRVSSYSAPLFPDKVDSSEKPKETQPQRKYYSYVLPSPIDTKSPISKTPTSVSPTPNNPFSKNERDFGNDASTSKARSTTKDGNSMDSSTQLPTPREGHSGFDSKLAKRQAYSGPLQPTKTFSGKIASTSGPISSTELPQIRSNATRSVSPPPLSSPKISELHELPRPPPKPAVLVSSANGTGGYLSSLSFKNPEISVSNKSSTASPLPPPPLAVSRSFSLHSSNNPSGRGGRVEEVSSPPLTPILLSSMKTTSRT
ncbi:arfaptin homology (AH) domain/BAR domain protein [Artemisia annua]|uniref:Arfaptin homology (AH) domain/BAR domain protein n=1 Tax=Artemisia annua TaxID=35608 RepID=A0A2U1MSG9_ARTAN|nr:arfaptin homology (AH) domain/BAR domain protein [Artemisia annua]